MDRTAREPVEDSLHAALMGPRASLQRRADRQRFGGATSSHTLASAFVAIVATYQSLRAGLACLLAVACSGI